MQGLESSIWFLLGCFWHLGLCSPWVGLQLSVEPFDGPHLQRRSRSPRGLCRAQVLMVVLLLLADFKHFDRRY